MKKKIKFSFPTKYLLLLLTVLCIALEILSFTDSSFAEPIRKVNGYLLTPIQKGMNEVGRWFTDKGDNLTSLKEVMAENEALKEKLDSLMIENNRLAQEKNELNQLREIYDLDQTYDYPKVAAKVIGKNPDNWFRVFQIDKGSDDGIKVDSNVIAGSGLVGIVTEVSPKSSIVRAIIDDSSNVSAKFSATSDICNVAGDLTLMNEGVIRVENISKDAEVENGYVLLTSHISDKFLPGILIGYASDISIDSNNLTKSGYVTPVVDFEHLEYVLVITELKSDME